MFAPQDAEAHLLFAFLGKFQQALDDVARTQKR